MDQALLSIQDLDISYKKNRILSKITIDVFKGQIVGLLGQNGAGKTTCFHSIMGFIEINSGQIFLDGDNITHLKIHERANKGMSYLTQTPSIFPTLTVYDNLMMILEFTTKKKSIRDEKVLHTLDLMKIRHFSKRKAKTLSGGEKRRLEIARALLLNPKILLLDEPFTNVDPKTIADLKEILIHLKQKGISILITDHNAKEILSFVDRVYLLHQGQILINDSPKKIIGNDKVISCYLGKSFAL